MAEVWKDIKNYEGLYQVSNLGRVKSLGRYQQNHGKLQWKPETIKIPSDRKRKDGSVGGYLTLQLYKDSVGQNCYVHRLVAEAFIPNPDGKATVNHKDGNKQNNVADNLEWMTYRENNRHAYVTGLNDGTHRRNNRASIPVEQYDADMNLVNRYPSMREAERQTGIDCTSISRGIEHGWKYGGYIWKLAGEVGA